MVWSIQNLDYSVQQRTFYYLFCFFYIYYILISLCDYVALYTKILHYFVYMTILGHCVLYLVCYTSKPKFPNVSQRSVFFCSFSSFCHRRVMFHYHKQWCIFCCTVRIIFFWFLKGKCSFTADDFYKYKYYSTHCYYIC